MLARSAAFAKSCSQSSQLLPFPSTLYGLRNLFEKPYGRLCQGRFRETGTYEIDGSQLLQVPGAHVSCCSSQGGQHAA